ncbi:SH3 domain-containing protein [Streptomyces sp. AV19]|uniref:SH3 domain-containing protein n=1 Tax=Streptomyces sp. AV19 TaxID=2793068 RepID=UPI0018FE16BE|nr:SH3 domain-containing protein [Streptomyces sp. AV19]MBH1938874.1 SH3 domain-containing protein [Streptomyces sp. AV19]MDG4533507.1 SH3 domain-containing protein [Streptomyces sp. AV19]
MRRISLALTTAALIGSTAAIAVPAQAATAPAPRAVTAAAKECHADNAAIYTDGTRLRAKASSKSAVKGQLYFKDPIRILKKSGSWDYVQLKAKSRGGLAKGTRGWVAHKNIIPPFCGF